jgi:hypothetical protein
MAVATEAACNQKPGPIKADRKVNPSRAQPKTRPVHLTRLRTIMEIPPAEKQSREDM